MDIWIRSINEQMGLDIWQLEQFCRNAIESLLVVVLCAIPLLFCVICFLAALDRMNEENKYAPQSLDQHKVTEGHQRSPKDRSTQPATRLLWKESNTAEFRADCFLMEI